MSFDRNSMKTVPPDMKHDMFAKINYWETHNGKRHILARINLEIAQEGAQTGLAIDGSASMQKLFGPVPAISPNLVQPVARKMCEYLAEKVDADGGTTVIYWATGNDGSEVQVIGDLKRDQALQYKFDRPKRYGLKTKLLPCVQFFAEHPDLSLARLGVFVIITDGAVDDIEDVTTYCKSLAHKVAQQRANDPNKNNPDKKYIGPKFLIIGLGDDVRQDDMDTLDNLDTGYDDIDFWDYRLAAELSTIEEIFGELVDANRIIADSGKVYDDKNSVVQNYSDEHVPALLEFDLPASSKRFVVEIGDMRIEQAMP